MLPRIPLGASSSNHHGIVIGSTRLRHQLLTASSSDHHESLIECPLLRRWSIVAPQRPPRRLTISFSKPSREVKCTFNDQRSLNKSSCDCFQMIQFRKLSECQAFLRYGSQG